MILGFGKYVGKGGVLFCEKIKTKPKPKTKTKPFEKDKILTYREHFPKIQMKYVHIKHASGKTI